MLSVIYAILLLLILSFIINIILIYLNNTQQQTSQDPETILAEKINDLLPQTQCGQCSFPGCKPYANAISKQQADINQCPPGGQETVDKIAELLNIESKNLILEENQYSIKKIARINEAECIGCLLCIKACPVDAIIGANKLLHTVIIDKCTGCDLCLPPCPMDCIEMVIRE
jgi:electron transport complex protein RnfB